MKCEGEKKITDVFEASENLSGKGSFSIYIKKTLFLSNFTYPRQILVTLTLIS